jgi:uncharacterized protein YfeS
MKRYAKQVFYLEDSTTHPGYKKYIITVVSKNGEKEYPAYGKDATDALKRLNWMLKDQEQTPLFHFLLPALVWLSSIVVPISFFLNSSYVTKVSDIEMIGILSGMIVVGVVGLGIYFNKIENYIERGKKG